MFKFIELTWRDDGGKISINVEKLMAVKDSKRYPGHAEVKFINGHYIITKESYEEVMKIINN